MRVVLFVLLFVTLVCAQQKRYDGYQLLSVYPKDRSEAEFVFELQGDVELDFWYEGQDRFDVLVPPHKIEGMQHQLTSHGIVFRVANANIQSGIDDEQLRLATKAALGKQAFDYEDFNTFDAIITEIDDLVARCPPGSMCETFQIGQSYQGRPLRGVHIYRAGSGRRAIWLDATIHAREWLATATHMKIMKHLVDDYTDANVAQLLQTYDFWMIPVANPDGYTYSHTTDRLWRKSRSPNAGSTCIGTDLNRNYNQMWGNAGASTAPCSETYRGSSAGSEVETQAWQNALDARRASLMLTIHFHTYGQLWLMPWGSVLPSGACNYATDNAEMLVIANACADAVQSTYNTQWARGNSCFTIYPASGITMDYSKGVSGVKYTFTPELRGNNFIVAANQINPSYVEVWNGVLAGIRAIERAP